jgi:uncharacterized protein
MFNRYWREFPWMLQVFQFIVMVFIFLGFAGVLSNMLITRLTGFELADIANLTTDISRPQANAMLLSQFIIAGSAFLIPPFLFAYITHPKPKWYLGLRAPGKQVQWALVVLVMLGAMPVMISLGNWMSHFDFGTSVKAAQEKNDLMMKGLLQMPTFSDFLKTFLVLAILPGVSEELFFRGIIMRFGAQKMRNIILPILISAALFAWSHSNIYGLPSIFLAGMLLGGIYYLTGSIWCSILAHILNNGLQIILMYMANGNAAVKTAMDSNELPWYFPVAGLVVFAVSFYLLWKNRTPLPASWTNDFADEKPASTGNFVD